MTAPERSRDPAGQVKCVDTGEPMPWDAAQKKYTHAGPCTYGQAHK